MPNAGKATTAAILAWLLPGAGYWMIGQRSRALWAGITILTLFVLGMLIGGMKVIDPAPSYADPVKAIMQRPWFVGQVLTGPIAIICAIIAKGSSFAMSHARINEIGTLYTAVAGMLNLLTIIDSSHRAAQQGDRP